MPITTEDFHTSLYDLLRTRGYEPIPLDSKGKTSPFYPEADIFKFSFVKNGKKYGDVWATVDSGLKLILYYDDDVASSPMGDTKGVQVGDSWPALLKHLKRWAQRRQLGFELKNKDHLVTDMQQREFTKKKEQLGEGYHPMGKKASYNDAIPKVKIVIQHSKQLGEGEQRFRHVEKIFVENTEGERFAVPTKKPGLAKVYARHVAEGGTPYDEKGRHLSTLIEEYSKMVGFMRATKNGEFSEAVTLVVEAGRNHFTSLRETLSKLMNHRGYHNYFDSWTPVLNEEQEDSNIATLFTKQQLDPRIANCIPILSKIARVDEAKPVTELDDWADQVISETTGMEMPPKKDPRHVTYRDKKQALKHYSGELEKDQTEKNKAAALAHYQSQLQTEDSDKLQGTPIVSLSDFGDKDNKKNKYGQTVPKKLKKDDPRVKFHKDQKKGVAEGDVVPFKKKDPLTPNLIKQLKALSQQALEIFWQGSDMPTAIQGQVAGLGKNEERRMFKQNENDLKALGYEYSINEQSPDILYLHSIAREAWYDADKPANMYRGLPDLMYDDKSNTLSYHDLIGDDGYEYDDTTTQFEGVAEGLDSDIQMGDKVEVNSPDDRDWHGREGTVIHMMDDTVVLELENGTKLRVTKDEVKKHQGVAEGLIEDVGGNYLYHSTEDAETAKNILNSGFFKAGPFAAQAATSAQTSLPVVSFGRNLAYQISGANVGRDYEVVFVVDRNALESRYKTIATSQSQVTKGLAYGGNSEWEVKANKFKPYLDIDKDGKLSQAELDNPDPKWKMAADNIKKYIIRPKSKDGGEFEEVVPTKTGKIPWKGMLIGFYLVPRKAASKDPELLNNPLRLDMPKPNRFVRANQTQGVAEEETSESLNTQQKRVGQLGPLEKAKTISPVLGQKEKQHPFQGKLVGASESIDPELKRIKALINKE